MVAREPMTSQEILCELYLRQGYLVLGCTIEHEIGELLKNSNMVLGDVSNVPVIIRSKATIQEFFDQDRLAKQISGRGEDCTHCAALYFYRVEAAD